MNHPTVTQHYQSTDHLGVGPTLLAPPTLRRAHASADSAFDVLLVGLYSERYAAIGESHGVSVIAGVLAAAPRSLVNNLFVMDMAAYGEEDPARIVTTIDAVRPGVVAIAVPYGAFSVLEAGYPAIRRAVDHCEARVVFGGALPTYLREEILDIDPRAVVVNGEGERPMLELLTEWSRGAGIEYVPGITFRRGGTTVTTDRSLANLATVPVPYRVHVAEVAAAGGQVYAESSRACSWAACTFCLRGLTDIDGKPREYRRFPPQRLAADFAQLTHLGISDLVFADEDFLGADVDAVNRYLDHLEPLLGPDSPRFEISTTIHSVYSYEDDREANAAKLRLLERLRRLGLHKVFLGIESGCDSQLRRYAKGHTAEECAAAIYRVQATGLRLEVGFIMFDPLCSIVEIEQNVAFIRRAGVVDAVSAVTNELRLQKDARYLHILQRHERQQGRQLYDRRFDRDTLSHDYTYADPDVARLLAGLRPANRALHAITYPVKNISRHGRASQGSAAASDVRELLAAFKSRTLTAIQAGVEAVANDHDPKPVVESAMIDAGQELTRDVIAIQPRLPRAQREHPVIVGLVERCHTFRRNPRRYVAERGSTVAA